jgi:hypothetical protein
MPAYLPHIVKRKLADGRTMVYPYAFRGGPRVPVSPSHPDFEKIRQEIVAECRAAEGIRLRKMRIRKDAEHFIDGGGQYHAVKDVAVMLVKNARYRAARRSLACDITVPSVLETLRSQEARCAISGIPFDLGFNLSKDFSRNPFAPSLDRIDGKKGYVQGNVRVVLAAVNYAINEWGTDAYLQICRAVAAKSQETTP